MSVILSEKDMRKKKAGETGSGVTDKSDLDFLRRGLIAESDAITLYVNQMNLAKDKNVKELFKHIAEEEKQHLAEFTALLKKLDPTFKEELNKLSMREIIAIKVGDKVGIRGGKGLGYGVVRLIDFKGVTVDWYDGTTTIEQDNHLVNVGL